jgi:23S rRNA (cytidine1920-2'-O)/16S rRNA (cytidine1409-2'-O)-methyltransferase
VANVLWAAQDLGVGTVGIVSSTIVGSQGNHEYLVWLSATRGRNPTEWLDEINSIVGA